MGLNAKRARVAEGACLNRFFRTGVSPICYLHIANDLTFVALKVTKTSAGEDFGTKMVGTESWAGTSWNMSGSLFSFHAPSKISAIA